MACFGSRLPTQLCFAYFPHQGSFHRLFDCGSLYLIPHGSSLCYGFDCLVHICFDGLKRSFCVSTTHLLILRHHFRLQTAMQYLLPYWHCQHRIEYHQSGFDREQSLLYVDRLVDSPDSHFCQICMMHFQCVEACRILVLSYPQLAIELATNVMDT